MDEIEGDRIIMGIDDELLGNNGTLDTDGDCATSDGDDMVERAAIEEPRVVGDDPLDGGVLELKSAIESMSNLFAATSVDEGVNTPPMEVLHGIKLHLTAERF